MINYRANIWALKELGVKRIVSPSAVTFMVASEVEEDLPSQALLYYHHSWSRCNNARPNNHMR